jgi:hypothetical protein
MTTAKKSLASLKSAFGGDEKPTNNTTFTNNYYPFWSMNTGQRAVVRFLPDLNESNPRGFLVDKVVHNLTINGQKRTIPCLSMYNEECPICKISQAYYKAKDEINGKKYWKNKQSIGQVLVIEDPLPADAETGENHQGKVRMITLGFQVLNIIKEAFASDELEGIPYDFEEGYDFIIKKTESGGYPSYAVGTKFSNKQRALTGAELEAVENGMVDLATLLPKNPGVEKVQAQLDAEMNGEEYDDGAFKPTKSAPKTTKDEDDDLPFVPTTKAPVTEAAEEKDDSVDDMLAQIRSRRKNKVTETAE